MGSVCIIFIPACESDYLKMFNFLKRTYLSNGTILNRDFVGQTEYY